MIACIYLLIYSLVAKRILGSLGTYKIYSYITEIRSRHKAKTTTTKT